MPFLTPPIDGERDALATFLEQQFGQLATTAHGLSEADARITHPPSSLSIAGLLVHAVQVGNMWLTRVQLAPEEPTDEQIAAGAPSFVSTGWFTGSEAPDDVSIEDLVNAVRELRSTVRTRIDDVDLDARVPVPEAPWFPQDLSSWQVRWVLFHLIAEIARHVGQADLIRESIDGAVAYQLNAAVDGEVWDG